MRKLNKQNIEDILALTPMQEGMLFHYLKYPESGYYFEQLSLEISGEIDRKLFEKAWNFVIDTNEMLRAVFRWEKVENPAQVILKRHKLQPGYYDVTGKKSKEKFDLREVPFRVTLCKIDDDKYEMIISNHHILYDGWSNGIILREFFKAYNDLSNEKELVKPVKTKFKEFVKWSRFQDNKKQEKFWKDYLKGFDTQTGISIKRRRGITIPITDTFKVSFSRDLKNKIEDFVKSHKITLASLLYSAWGILLQRYNNSEDVIFGTTISGRKAKIQGIEEIVGLFINTLPLRIQTDSNEKTVDFLYRIDKGLQIREAYETTPLVKIKECSEIDNNEELFDSIIVIENYPLDIRLITGNTNLPVDSYTIVERTHYDLTVGIMLFDKVEVKFSYNPGCFDKETIENLACHFKCIVQRVVENPEQEVGEIEIISMEEKNRLLYDFNDTAAVYPTGKTIHQLFEEQAERSPDNTALHGCMITRLHGEEVSITYKELNEQSNRLAHVLQSKGTGTGPDTVMAVMVEPSLEMIIGILGILKSGGAYLPIDPGYPQERVEYMLTDSGAKMLITTDIFYSSSPPRIFSPSPSSSLAYVIYTSGTTGRSKGVLIEHRNLVNYVNWFSEKAGLTVDDGTVLTSSFCFDLGYTTIYPPLSKGSRLHIVPRQTYLSTEALLHYIGSHRITTIKVTPSLFRVIVEDPGFSNKSFCTVRLVVLGGEAVKVNDVETAHALGNHLQIMNHYGPTEATIGCVAQWIAPGTFAEFKQRPTIGYPIGNMRVYILDKNSNLAPVGVCAELCVCGAGVGRGYLNRPQLTAEKFLHPSPIYKTGDLARWLPDGKIEFIGRIDTQVKIRGYRVEPGEIENCLLAHKNIKEAAVVAVQSPAGDTCLCAYTAAAKQEKEFDPSGLERYLSKNLPDYMVPSYFAAVEKIPLTANGKLNRKLLPSPEIKAGRNYTPPRNPVERRLVEMWRDILGSDASPDSLGIDDHFFHRGGHSLKAMILVSRIHKAFQTSIPLAEIFKRPTIRGLAEYIKKNRENIYTSIEPVERKNHYALSSAQERLYFLYRMDEQSTGYNMSYAVVLEGSVDRNKLENVFFNLIERHESLRTSFVVIGEEPFQRIRKEVEFKTRYYDASRDEHSSLAIHDYVRIFDLSRAPLFGASLVKLAEDRHILLVDMHHIIADGISARILIQDFTALYAGKELPPIRLRYKDYAGWQNGEREGENLLKQEDYWKNQFEGEIPVLELPLDFTRPPVQGFAGSSINFEINRESLAALKTLALKTGATLYMVLLALYNVFLARISSREDIVAGSPAAGRRHTDLENIIGMFVNTLALRNFPHGEKRFIDFLGEVKEKTLKAFENQDYQYEDLVEQVDPARDTGRNPLFDTMFTLRNIDALEIEIPGLKVQTVDFETRTAKFDLTLTAVETGENLRFTFEYCTGLFKKETIRRFIRYFNEIISTVCENRGIRISGIEIVTGEEKNQILRTFNDTEMEYPKDKTIHQLFEDQVERTPSHIALVGTGLYAAGGEKNTGKREQLTYSDLYERSRQLAYRLSQKGLQPGNIAGIMVERCVEMIIGILAILEAGGAFLPIDPGYPAERKAYILADSGAGVLVTPEYLLEQSGQPPLPPLPAVRPSDMVYLIYTSGSTGAPKGVVVEHRNAVAYVYAFYNEFPVSSVDVFLQQTAVVFDVFVEEVFTVLLKGGKSAVPGKEEIRDVHRLARFIARHGVTIISCSPFLLSQLNNLDTTDTLGMVRFFISGGDVLRENYIDHLLSLGKVYNAYGPTEATIGATYYPLPAGCGSPVPIGKPIANYTVVIMDRFDCNQLAPPGVPGELCIGGVGVTRGYLNNPEFSAEKFIHNRFRFHSPYAAIYRTGDLARWIWDGNIEFLGRIDHQVKIRGFRIELGEIENQLLKHEKIKESVVITGTGKQGDKYLCAYIAVDQPVEISKLRRYLSGNLPDYMIPSYVVQLDKIPLTPNGKIHRKALPVPEIRKEKDYAEPRDELEKKLVEIWSEVLGIEKEKISITGNFFHLGGHSLKAAALASRVHKELHVNVPLPEIFKTPHIRGLAAYIKIKQNAKEKYISIEPVEKKEYYELSSAQKKLFILDQTEGAINTAYNLPGAVLIEGELDIRRLENSFNTLITRHDSFRTSFDIKGGKPVQIIHDTVVFKIKHSTPAEGHPGIANDFIKPFELGKTPLLRVALTCLGSQEHLLLFDMHHIISDGVSAGILVREFVSLYEGNTLPELQLQYKDFPGWQNKRLDSEEMKKQEDYWLDRFNGDIPVLEMPVDYPRQPVKNFEGDSITWKIDGELTGKINEAMAETGTTLYMILLAIFYILLSRYTGQEDIIVGVPAAARSHPDLENIIGMFVNTLAVRNYPGKERSFDDFLQEVKENALKAFENQDYPFEELVDKLEISKDYSRNPLFDVLFVSESLDIPRLELKGLTLTPFEIENRISHMDLVFYIVEEEDTIVLRLEYASALFSRSSVEGMLKHYAEILEQAVKDRSVRLEEIDTSQDLLVARSNIVTGNLEDFGF